MDLDHVLLLRPVQDLHEGLADEGGDLVPREAAADPPHLAPGREGVEVGGQVPVLEADHEGPHPRPPHRVQHGAQLQRGRLVPGHEDEDPGPEVAPVVLQRGEAGVQRGAEAGRGRGGRGGHAPRQPGGQLRPVGVGEDGGREQHGAGPRHQAEAGARGEAEQEPEHRPPRLLPPRLRRARAQRQHQAVVPGAGHHVAQPRRRELARLGHRLGLHAVLRGEVRVGEHEAAGGAVLAQQVLLGGGEHVEGAPRPAEHRALTPPRVPALAILAAPGADHVATRAVHLATIHNLQFDTL